MGPHVTMKWLLSDKLYGNKRVKSTPKVHSMLCFLLYEVMIERT